MDMHVHGCASTVCSESCTSSRPAGCRKFRTQHFAYTTYYAGWLLPTSHIQSSHLKILQPQGTAIATVPFLASITNPPGACNTGVYLQNDVAALRCHQQSVQRVTGSPASPHSPICVGTPLCLHQMKGLHQAANNQYTPCNHISKHPTGTPVGLP